MVDFRRHLLATSCAAVVASLWFAQNLQALRFYPDDPIRSVPAPRNVLGAEERQINEYIDLVLHTIADRRTGMSIAGRLAGGAINTVGEAPDSAWFQNRHGTRRMDIEALRHGAAVGDAPSFDGPWEIVSAKLTGITPGFEIRDIAGRRFVLKFDPRTNPEMATAADVIGSRFFYAFGYNVPENYLVRFHASQLKVTDQSLFKNAQGPLRRMTERDKYEVLSKAPREPDQRFRAVASLYIPGRIIGPFQFFGVRMDDPNDIVPHEDRLDLRGLYAFAAWLNHHDVRAGNTLDTIVNENGIRYIRHYLIDFGSTLGSGALKPKIPSAGYEYIFDFEPALRRLVTLGFAIPHWQLADYPDLPAVGRFESEVFDPRAWKPNRPTPAFDKRLPTDTYWAAKIVMTFTDDDIRAIVSTGEYTNTAAKEYIVRTLIERRNKIGRTFLTAVLPVDNFTVRGGRLIFDDLAVRYGFAQPRTYNIQWSRFDNERDEKYPIGGTAGSELPGGAYQAPAGTYMAADITTCNLPDKEVTAYVRKTDLGFEIAGVDRTW